MVVYCVVFLIISLFAECATPVAFSMREYAGGRPSQSSVSPKALPLHPHPLGHGKSSAFLCVLRC